MSLRIGLSYCSSLEDADYARYPDALRRAGTALGVDVEAAWLATNDHGLSAAPMDGLDGVCFTGGGDVSPERFGQPDLRTVCRHIDERRDAIEWALAEQATAACLPVLGICRGAQLLNVVHGGTLIGDLPETGTHVDRTPGRDARHAVRIAAGTLLARLAGAGGETNSSHHQAVDVLAPDFRPAARAPDGIVEAFEWSEPDGKPFLLAVQWHPERMERGVPLSDGVLRAFLTAARRTFPVERSASHSG